METVIYKQADTDLELELIISLQRKNLPTAISSSEKKKEGFLTVEHNFDILKKMNDREPHIIAKDGENVIGYALCMVQEFKSDIEILKPMFEKIDQLLDPTILYITMGQICIDKAYRKRGIFRGLYHKMREELQGKYKLLITEVAANNNRSLQAHYTVGFTDLLVYNADDINWHLIGWNWK